ncbi:MAG TPA: hypothetical protein VK890_12035, partial [Bacteroidia bacterium]|nr:hypothetical protein [Bacteroidia bacterium]
MKNIIMLGAAMLSSTLLFAQTELRNADGSHYKQCVRFRETEPLWKIAKEHPVTKRFDKPRLADDDAAHRLPNEATTFNPYACTTDGALQTEAGTVHNDGPVVNVDGA